MRSILLLLSSAVVALAAPAVSVLVPSNSSVVSSFTSLSVTFSEAVTGVDANDISINNEAPVSVSGSGAGPYVFTFTQPAPGSVGVAWEPDHGITGIGTGEFAPPAGYTFTLTDTVAPALLQTTPVAAAVLGSLTQVQVVFSERVTGVDAADLLVNGVAATAVTGIEAGPYVFTITQPATGTVNFTWVAGHGITDVSSATNAFGGAGWSITRSAAGPGSVLINEFLAVNGTGLADEDAEQNDWIEIINTGATTVNLRGWSLTDDIDEPGKWVFPSRTLNAGAVLVIFASAKNRTPVSGNLHTNFKLNENGGGTVALYTPDSPRTLTSANFTAFPPQRTDYSYGRGSGGNLYYFTPPSPNAANAAGTLSALAAEPTVSAKRGFFKDPFSVHLSHGTPGGTIRYTLDGSVPTASSTAYSGPISVSNTTILRAATFATNFVPSATVTHSYLYLDSIFSQPSPPYDNPGNATDDANPDPPVVGGVALPVHWGTNGSFQNTTPGGAGYVPFANLPASNSIPADYGMDTKIVNDPNKYDNAGTINAAGITNLDRMKVAIRELPIVSVVLPCADMWGPTGTGLYPNSSESSKPDLTKLCNIEMLMPDGTTAFSATCGIDLHGNASRAPYKNPKHGFTLKFKGDYGAGTLDYPVFTDSPVEKHDKLILRADFNYSWRHQEGGSQRPFGNRVRDAWSKDTFRAMGRPAGHHRYVNLFINGIYWGSYDLAEDEGDNFGADYFGGDKSDYDVMEQGALKNGTATAYNAMTAIATPIDNPKYEQMKTYLDVPEFIDYMLLHFFVGHTDWGDAVGKNWYAVRNWRKNGTYKFLPWDMENLLAGETVDRTGVASPAAGLHPKLVGNTQYLLDFADRIHRHMVSPDGALLPAANVARLNKWMAIMNPGQQALESARWGDYRMTVHNYTSSPYNIVYTWNGKWYTTSTQTSTQNAIAEQTRLNGTYFPARTNNVLGQLRTRLLYPLVNAPEIRDNVTNIAVASKSVAAGYVVKFANVTSPPGGTSNASTFYYTTNGTDPRVYYSGTVAAGATSVAPNATLTINSTTALKVRAFNGTTWSALNEQTFTVGAELLIPPVRITEIMYNPLGNQNDEAKEFIELRNAGTQPVDISGWYLRGVDCIIPHGTVLNPGDHFLLASNDNPSAFAAAYPGTTPGAYFGGTLANNGERISLHAADGRTIGSVDYRDEFPWPAGADGNGPSIEIVNALGDPDDPGNWKASATANGTPGAANSAPPPASVIINEIFINNAGIYSFGGTTPGYVELLNTHPSDPYTFNNCLLVAQEGAPVLIPNGTTLAPGAFLLIHLSDIAGLPLPSGIPAMRPDGGTLALANNGASISAVRYGPQAVNHSFGRVAGSWTLTTPTPGAANVASSTAPLTNLKLNEWYSNPPPGIGRDWVELYNTHPTLPVSLVGLFAGANGELYQLNSLASVAPLGWARIFCNEGTNLPGTLDFNLPAGGTTMKLYDTNGVTFETVTLAAQAERVSTGRLPDGSATITTLGQPSPGIPNHAALTGTPQLNEILTTNFNGENAPWGARPGWIELRNPTGGALSVSGWKLRSIDGGTQWTIPSGVSIPAGGHLAIWSDYNQFSSTVAGTHLNCAVDFTTFGRAELLNPIGQVADAISWGQQIADLSIGRVAGGAWALNATPTRGGTNSAAAALGPVSAVKLNEWSTGIELYNTSAQPVALEGLFLSDEFSEVGRRKYQITSLSFIAGNGFALFNAMGGPSNATYTGFILDTMGGESLRLSLSDNTALDSAFFGAFSTQSRGRSPDGSGAVANLAAYTPGFANIQGTGPWCTGYTPSRVVRAGGYVNFYAGFSNNTSLQWFKNGASIPSKTNNSLDLFDVSTNDDATYWCEATFGGNTTASPPVTLTVLHTYDTWIASYGYPAEPPDGDIDLDDLSNIAEFIANTDPTIGATPAERAAVHPVLSLQFNAGAPQNLLLDFRLNRRACFSSLTGELSPNLTTWAPTAPLEATVQTFYSNGDQYWRLKYALPPASPRHFLRLGITE